MSRRLDPLTFPIHGRQLIEASAGTGKTYTIGALYLRLVLGHGGKNGFHRALMPPEILVVTFTNAATEELRHRIRQKLVEAAGYFNGTCKGDGFLEGLAGAFPKASWPEKARVLEQSSLWMDEAAIHTIHSWSSRMLRQHAFLCGSLFDLELAPDDENLLEEAACDYWRSHLYHLPPRQLADLLALIQCSTPEALLDRVRPILRRDPLLEGDPFELLGKRHQAIETARREWSADFETAANQIRDAASRKILNGRTYAAGSLEKEIRQMGCWAADNGPLPDARLLYKFSHTGLNEGANKNKTPPEHHAYEALDLLNNVLDPLDVEKALLVHAAREIHARYQHQKALQKIVDFDDLLDRLNEALHRDGNGRLAQTISEQYPVAMIDEFQDTDPVQYTAFSKIYGGRPQTAFLMIGDPKQSIYAFRGADIQTYLRARKDTGDVPHTLDANYRATKELVHAVNQMFGFANKHPEGPFLFNNRIPFEPVVPKGPEGELVIRESPSSGLHIRQMSQKEPVPKTGPRGYLSKMAEDFAGEIVHLLNLAEQVPPRAFFRNTPDAPLKPLRPADVAIMVRSGGEARIIRKELDKCGIRSVYLSDKTSVFDAREARDVLYLLRACAWPGVERTLKAALATPILDLPLHHLDDLNRNEAAWEKEIERFGRYQWIWHTRGVLPMLRTLLQDFGMSSGLLTATEGERAATNFLHLAELLQAKSLELEGPQGLINWLEDQLQKHPAGSAEQILRLESDEALVKVVTIHKSKGLQYPLVFLPFVCSFRQTTPKDMAMATYRDEQGDVRLVKPLDSATIGEMETKRLAEDLRLLYVAVTRAQYACWMGIGVMGRKLKNGEKNTLHLSGFGYLLSGGEVIPTRELSRKLQSLKGQCQHITFETMPETPDHTAYTPNTQTVPLMPARPFDTPVFRDWRISSYSGILKATGTVPQNTLETAEQGTPFDFPFSSMEDQLRESEEAYFSYPEQGQGKPSIHNFPKGPEPGTFLHGLLEWAAREGFNKVARDPSLIDAEVQRRSRHRGWQNWVDALRKWLQDFLKTPIPLPGQETLLRLTDLPSAGYRPELEFLFAAHRVHIGALDGILTREILPGSERAPLQNFHINGMLKGFIDLVFEFQGKYYVLDYKSNHLGENTQAYQPNAMVRAMLSHRYDLQYVLYTLALHRLLKARLPEYRYQKDMGGAVYLFLRGIDKNRNGIYGDKPPEVLIEKLDFIFEGSGENR
ncbi:exodeoxyribonuclease V, beta subunit [delta proteobacterium NaphS2]|nr:exodeoxyribonuclease V, beta subunit [delta proteobacterium NaphS2]